MNNKMDDEFSIMTIAKEYKQIKITWLWESVGRIYRMDSESDKKRYIGSYTLYTVEDEYSFEGNYEELVAKSIEYNGDAEFYEYRFVEDYRVDNEKIEIIISEDSCTDEEYDIDDIDKLIEKLKPDQPSDYGLEIRINHN